MSLSVEERNALIELRLETADRFLSEARKVADLGLWDLVANRIYYAAFHAVAALLIRDQFEVRSHNGAGLMFGKHYVRKGLFSAEDGKLYSKLQDLREKCDYNLIYQSDEREMRPLMEQTLNLVERIKDQFTGK